MAVQGVCEQQAPIRYDRVTSAASRAQLPGLTELSCAEVMPLQWPSASPLVQNTVQLGVSVETEGRAEANILCRVVGCMPFSDLKGHSSLTFPLCS